HSNLLLPKVQQQLVSSSKKKFVQRHGFLSNDVFLSYLRETQCISIMSSEKSWILSKVACKSYFGTVIMISSFPYFSLSRLISLFTVSLVPINEQEVIWRMCAFSLTFHKPSILSIGGCI